jgi:drug/metabolite transporter (DMT)-like permease
MSGRVVAILSLLLVMLLWGTSFVVTKAILDEVPPLLLALLRFAVASALLVPLVQLRGGPALLPRPLPLGTLCLMALTGVTLFIVCSNLSLVYTTVTDASLIQASIPAVTAVLAFAILGERLDRLRLFSIGASVVGVALIVLAGGHGGEAPNPLLGDLLMLGAVVCWAAYTILGKALPSTSRLALTAYSTLLGTVLLIPAAAYDLVTQAPMGVSVESWLAVLYMGAVPSASCYLLWNRALGHLDAGHAATFINLIPVVGVIGAALFLDERPAPAELAGGAVVLAGVWLASFDRPSRRR